jgi:hypothetical protein
LIGAVEGTDFAELKTLKNRLTVEVAMAKKKLEMQFSILLVFQLLIGKHISQMGSLKIKDLNFL